jgi:D-alanyl-D-alanine carboxypeptidase
MKRFALFAVFALGLTEPAASAAPSTGAMRSAVKAQMQESKLSGVVLVSEDGGNSTVLPLGIADRAFMVPITAGTRFRIASITKTFTASMILQLVDEGRINLDRPVKTYLPDLRGGARAVTVRQLLNHTSGIAQFDRIASLEQALIEGVPNYQRPMTAVQLLAACCEGELAHPPGSTFDYNNADYLLLGRIIERLDRRPFEQSLMARIVAPLGLANTGLARQQTIVARLAPTYFLRPGAKALMNDLPFYFENWDAAGGMYSTARDVERFAAALFGGKVIRPSSLAEMLKPGKDDYGLGLWSYSLKHNGKTYRVAKRPGSIMGSNAVLYRLIDQRRTIIILANSNEVDLDALAQRLAERLIELG